MRPLRILALGLLIGSAVHADTIRLRDGKEYEGVVISEDGDSYTVMVQVTETIRDQRRIPKKDILEIVKQKKDAAAFEKIKDLVPTPERLEVDEYDARIEEVESFLKEHGDSRLARSAASILETLDAEREVIASGGVKFEGKLLSATERQALAFTLDSQIVSAAMEEAIAEGRKIDALRAWDKLQEEFPSSRAYAAGIPKILPVMQVQLAAVERELEDIDERVEERLRKLERVPSKDRARVKEAIELEAADYKKLVEAEREAGIRWTSLNPFEKEPLNKARSLLEAEIRRIENFDPSRVPDGDAAWAAAWATLNGTPDLGAAREALSKARSARLPRKYIEILEAKMPSK